jgi:3-hydroxyisobutyrate dehydrogenase
LLCREVRLKQDWPFPCLGEARKNGATLPVAGLVDQFYAEVQRMGGKRWDTSSLIARLER